MISCTNSRYNGGNEPYVSKSELSAGQAFSSFIAYEIGFGTSITTIESTRLICRTNAMGTLDVVEFSGTVAEMEHLIAAAICYIHLRMTYHDELISAAIELLPKTNQGGYQPLIVEHFSPLLVGMGLIPAVALFGIGVEPSDELLLQRSGDILAAAELHLDHAVPFLEILFA